MKQVKVDVCVCTSCVMNGSVDIIEAIDSLSLLKGVDHNSMKVEVVTHPLLGGIQHVDESPVIIINGETLEKANSQTAMSRVLAYIIEGDN